MTGADAGGETDRLAFPYARQKLLLLVLAVAPFALAALALAVFPEWVGRGSRPPPLGMDRWPVWAVRLLFLAGAGAIGLVALAVVRQLRADGPAVVLDHDGVWIEGITTRSVPWSEIRGFRRSKTLGADVVRLEAPHERHFAARRWGFRQGLVINLGVLAADADEVVAALERFVSERGRGAEGRQA